MANENILNIKDIINILRNETSLVDGRKYIDWKEVALEDGEKTRRKDEFECYLYCQKIPLGEIEAQEFLLYAKHDFEENSDKGRINSLPNAKRAIECRIDECLKLLNLRDFSSRCGWNLPYKIEVLQTFGVVAPSILKRLVSSKRNLLEHEYIRPNQEEAQNIVEIAELFVKATDKYVENGYISSATITYTAWFQAHGTEVGQLLSQYFGMSDEYNLDFDFKNGKLTLKNLEKELIGDIVNGQIIEHEELESKEKRKPVVINIRDCSMEDIRELMILLREKGKFVCKVT